MSVSSSIRRILRVGLLVALSAPVLAGCASYYTHYAMFPAENSAGEVRDVRVSWQSAEYPGWWLMSDKATTIKVETECSQRVWRLGDDSHGAAEGCGDGVRACGDPRRDLLAGSGQPADPQQVCMSISQPDQVQRVADIGGTFAIRVSCTPARTRIEQDGEEVDVDYLRASTVPYTVHARKVPRGSLSARLPEFDESRCEAE